MRRILHTMVSAAALCAGLLAASAAIAAPLGSAFSYQGQLKDAGQAANGLYDLQVCLFDDPANPVPLDCIANINDVPVEDGVFSVALDFGTSPFGGELRFLELRVRPGPSAGAYTTLVPRQAIRPAPEALRAATSSAAPWSGLSGVPAGFADGVDNTGSGTVTSISTGTGLTGGPITDSGTVAIANGGVGSAQLAAGAVGATHIAGNAIGAAQINNAQVQARVGGSCPLGRYLRGVNPDGTVLCADLAGVTTLTIVDDPVNSAGLNTSIALGADGVPVISHYSGSTGTLRVAKCANAACTGTAIVTVVDDPANNVGRESSIAIGADGLPVISYEDLSAGSLKFAKCANPACTAAVISVVDDPVNSVGRFTSVAIGSDGLPVISYRDATAGTLKVAKCVNAACSAPAIITTVDSTGNDVGWFTAIAIGTDGLPVISYHDNTADRLKVAKCVDAACSGGVTITTLNDTAINTGQYTSIAIGADGLPVISYTDGATLKVAKCANAACTGAAAISAVDDPANFVGLYTSIEVGADGLPVISYSDVSARALKVAKCADAACSGAAIVTTIDDPTNLVGDDTSIAIGADGLPVISYTDIGAGALKVAKCGTPSCR